MCDFCCFISFKILDIHFEVWFYGALYFLTNEYRIFVFSKKKLKRSKCGFKIDELKGKKNVHIDVFVCVRVFFRYRLTRK